MRKLLRALCFLALPGLLLVSLPDAAAADAPPVQKADPAYQIRFPEDEGSHPGFGGEWWYLSGWLDAADGTTRGFQVTFFRFRQDRDKDGVILPVPAQILVGHAALSDPQQGAALHDQRTAPADLQQTFAREGAMDIRVGDWSMRKEADGAYMVAFPTAAFGLDLRLEPTQPPMLNGNQGYSQKTPDPTVASHYYSVPQLAVKGTLTRDGTVLPVTGTAWLDREWFTTPEWIAQPRWDWIGINLADGGALMASQVRDAAGTPIWTFGSLRDATGALTVLAPKDVSFTPLRQWRSPPTGIVWPVAWRVRAGRREVTIEPLMDDQEYDARETSRLVYWEGAASAAENGEIVGRGYLELTGYGPAQP
ncbi:MAG: lipocalin-like domain-containing protein [Rhodospirillales bacterium]